MRRLKIAVFTALFALSFLLTACGGGHGHDHSGATQEQGADRSGPEYTSAYICPMHCPGSGSDQPGKCPECGMDYVANKDQQGDGHGHDEEGHDHH
jgi:predicted small secreted protein